MRAFDYVYKLDLFTGHENPDLLVMNEQFSRRYFSNIEGATLGIPESFLKEKKKIHFGFLCRAVQVLTDFPYHHSACFASFENILVFEHSVFLIEKLRIVKISLLKKRASKWIKTVINLLNRYLINKFKPINEQIKTLPYSSDASRFLHFLFNRQKN